MTDTPSFLDEADGTREEIMKATFHALCEYGYKDLTIQHISDEFGKSKSLLYYHYDGKDDLLLDFLDFMLERFEDQIPYPEGGSAADHLDELLDQVLFDPRSSDFHGFAQAMVELRAQGAHDAEFREHFTRSDEFIRKQIARIIRKGIDEGVFRDVDSRRTATLLQTIIVGTMTEQMTTDDDRFEAIRDETDRYLQRCVLADE
ncbi:TetR/AcrR family transcriptional regulator [Haladaptatus sp.]|uniref:TetR/AcrR family transcriptional regulator n=1 Tax=Haladaptatus sp. TaxID=1973141 RepID=UPI003C40FC49